MPATVVGDWNNTHAFEHKRYDQIIEYTMGPRGAVYSPIPMGNRRVELKPVRSRSHRDECVVVRQLTLVGANASCSRG